MLQGGIVPVLVILVTSVYGETEDPLITNLTLATDFLADYNSKAEVVYYNYITAHWNYATNLTDYNSARVVSTHTLSVV